MKLYHEIAVPGPPT